MRISAHLATLLLLVLASAPSCASDAPTASRGTSTPAPLAPKVPTNPIDPRAAVAYARVSPSMHAKGSLMALNPDGTFDLRFSNADFPGLYFRSDSAIDFHFFDSSAGGAWVAKGVISRDTLLLRFNDVMVLANFEDGRYVKLQPVATPNEGSAP